MIDPTWLTAGSSLINALTGGGKAPAGPAISGAPVSTLQDWDFSGFTATTGSGNKVTGSTNNKRENDSLTGGGTASGSSSSSGAWIIGLAALAGLVMGG